MGLDASFASSAAGISRQHFGHIRLCSGILARFIFAQSIMHHQLGSAHLRIGLCERKLYALVLSNRPAKYLAFFGIVAGLIEEPFGIANALCRDQGALGIHA